MEEQKEKKQRNKIIKIGETKYAELEQHYNALKEFFEPKQKKEKKTETQKDYTKTLHVTIIANERGIYVNEYKPTIDDCVEFFTRKENFEKWNGYKSYIDGKVAERAEKAERGRKMAEARNAKNK